eukprot:Opistho-2@19783
MLLRRPSLILLLTTSVLLNVLFAITIVRLQVTCNRDDGPHGRNAVAASGSSIGSDYDELNNLSGRSVIDCNSTMYVRDPVTSTATAKTSNASEFNALQLDDLRQSWPVRPRLSTWRCPPIESNKVWEENAPCARHHDSYMQIFVPDCPCATLKAFPDPAFFGTYAVKGPCLQFPLRPCYTAIEHITPYASNAEFMADKPTLLERYFNPPASFIPWGRFLFQGFEALANRRAGSDCIVCFMFNVDRQRWTKLIETDWIGIQNLPLIRGGSQVIRTALDIGGGAGGLASVLSSTYDVHTMVVAYEWKGLPYLHTAAARGVLTLQVDAFKRLPLVDGAVDFVHSAWLINVVNSTRHFTNSIYEWERVCRPGGYLMVTGFNKPLQLIAPYIYEVFQLYVRLNWRIISFGARGSNNVPVLELGPMMRKVDAGELKIEEVIMAAKAKARADVGYPETGERDAENTVFLFLTVQKPFVRN